MNTWFQRWRIRRLARQVGGRLRDMHGNHLFYPLSAVMSVCVKLGENARTDAVVMFAHPEEADALLAGTREVRRARLIAAILRKRGAFAENPNSNCFHDPDHEVRARLRELGKHSSPGDQSGINDTPSSSAFSGPGGSD